MSEIRVLRNNYPPVPKPADENARQIRERRAAADAAEEAAKSAERQQRDAWLVQEIEAAAALGLRICKVTDWHNNNGSGFARLLTIRDGKVTARRASVYLDGKHCVTHGSIRFGTYLRVRVGEVQPGHNSAEAFDIEMFTD